LLLHYVNQCRWGSHERPDKEGNATFLQPLPNPGDNVITVRSANELKFVKVCDAAGKLMKSIEMQNSFTKNIDIADFNKGVYILKAVSKTGVTYAIKFVKK
jgi:hypothetical protein